MTEKFFALRKYGIKFVGVVRVNEIGTEYINVVCIVPLCGNTIDVIIFKSHKVKEAREEFVCLIDRHAKIHLN